MTRKSKCRGCGGHLAKGDTVVRLRLKKRYQMPCTGCGHKPAKLKFFHTQCVPKDINAAMGFDPNCGAAPVTPGNAVPPPPKPKSVEDLNLEALAALEAAVIMKARTIGCNAAHSKLHATPATGCKACEMEKAFKTFQNIKARVLRPGTPGEGEAAITVALKRTIDLVYGS